MFSSLIFGCGSLYNWVGGNFIGEPSEMNDRLSPGAGKLLSAAFSDLDRDRLADFHVHVAGTDSSNSGIWMNPDIFSWWHPIMRFQFKVYMSAACVTDIAQADEQYMDRLVKLTRSVPDQGRYFIYAMDRHYLPDGRKDNEATTLYVPNEYIFSLAKAYPDRFVPVMSVHPYRKDALQEMERWAKVGGRFIKWLPNTMGIDPGLDRLVPIYRFMRERDIVLLTHTGRERAIDASDQQELGNPLLLRKPLDMGVKAVALHCASDGEGVDLDDPDKKKVSNFDLFLRLMDEPRYEGLLFGEISAVTFMNRLGKPLKTILERRDLHHRIVNGSDYPLPGINFLIHTKQLADEGYITEAEAGCLNEIYGYNPLLFDFVVKRTLRHPATGKKLSPSIFMIPEALWCDVTSDKRHQLTAR